MEFNKSTIGSAMRTARDNLGLSQDDVAERANISTQHVGRIERSASLCSIEVLVQICNALQTTPNILLGVDPNNLFVAVDPEYSPEIRRIIRRLRSATPGTLRLVSVLLKELDR